MKETYWAYWLVLLGVFVIGVMLLVNNISTTNTQDYYNIKEVTQASMIDAVDFSYYRLYGNVKMSEQKFVENFMRRFVENVNLSNTYEIGFYDITEVPPKVSVKISTGSRSFNIANTRNDYDVVTTLNAVLELGNEGEASEGIKKVKERSCGMYITQDLLLYLQGKTVKDCEGKPHNINNESIDRGSYNIHDEQLQSFTGKDITEFRNWFDNNFKIDGESANAFLGKNIKYGGLPEFIKEWHQRCWLSIK